MAMLNNQMVTILARGICSWDFLGPKQQLSHWQSRVHWGPTNVPLDQQPSGETLQWWHRALRGRVNNATWEGDIKVSYWSTLWSFNSFAIELLKMVIFHSYVNVYQRVE